MVEVLDVRELAETVPEGDDGLGEHRLDGRRPRWRAGVAVGVVLMLAAGATLVIHDGRSGPSASDPPTEDVAIELAARAALDAWARFASSGDVATTDRTFHPDGPQRVQLEAEATSVRPVSERSYVFVAEGLVVEKGHQVDERRVQANVAIRRAGEVDRRYAWELEMRRTGPGGPWLLWTVHDRPSELPSGGAA